jgi:hypothetical protein
MQKRFRLFETGWDKSHNFRKILYKIYKNDEKFIHCKCTKMDVKWQGGVFLSIQVFDLENHKCTMTFDTRGLLCNLKANFILIYWCVDRYTKPDYVLSRKWLLLQKVITWYEVEIHPIKDATFTWKKLHIYSYVREFFLTIQWYIYTHIYHYLPLLTIAQTTDFYLKKSNDIIV